MASRKKQARTTVERALFFVNLREEDFINAIRDLIDKGAQSFLFQSFNELACSIAEKVAAQHPEVDFFAPLKAEKELPHGISRAKVSDVDVVILSVSGGKALSAALMDFVDYQDIVIVAPITDWYFKHRPLFLISIPKAGTHLLDRLVTAFGYSAGVGLGDVAEAGTWYCIEYSNTHTSARDFFIDTVRRSPFGNRHHPFMCSPAIFIYRNPLDVVVSEVHYYHKDGKTAFSGYLHDLSVEERLSRLIDDPWLLGSIRDRISNFIAWLDFQNVIPVSFEELVGPEGDGDRQGQLDVIWSLQLKLQVPGSPTEFAGQVFDQNSPTFFSGKIGNYRNFFTHKLFKKFQSLNQDFMISLGYDGSNLNHTVKIPKRALEFRKRPIIVSEEDYHALPMTVKYDFLGNNLVRYKGRFYGIPRSAGIVDIRVLPDDVTNILPQAQNLIELEHVLVNSRAHVEEIQRWQDEKLAPLLRDVANQNGVLNPERWRNYLKEQQHYLRVDDPSSPMFIETYRGFNIVRYGGKLYGVRQSLSEIEWELTSDELLGRYPDMDFFVRETIDDVKTRIDMIETRISVEQQCPQITGRLGQNEVTVSPLMGSFSSRLVNWLKRLIVRR